MYRKISLNPNKMGRWLTVFILFNGCLGIITTAHSDSWDVFYVIIAAYFFLYLFITKKLIIPHFKEWYISALMLVLWMYGMVVGIIKGNNPAYIFRNFAGMLVYVFFLFLYSSKLKTKTLETLLLGLSVFSCFLTIFGYITAIRMQIQVIYTIPILNSFQPGYGILYDSCNLIYIAYVYSLYNIMIMKNYKIRFWIMIFLDLFAAIVCMEVSSFVLGFLAFTGLMFVLAFQKKTTNKKIEMTILIIFILLCFAAPVLLKAFFSDNDWGNARRWKQIEFVINDFQIFGHGLGATYSKEIGSLYAIEVILLDVFYKFGVFALLIYYAYIYSVIKAIKLILKSYKNPYSVIPLSCMGYLFLGLSNPVIFAPSSVIAHCCSLLLIFRYKENQTCKNQLF